MVRANHIVWVAWQHHLRNHTMSEQIGAQLHELRSSLPRPLRYLTLGLRTTWLLIRHRRARAVIAQNPSIVLALVTIVLGRLLDMQVAIDAHNAALDPPGGRLTSWAARQAVMLAPLTIVTNEVLAARVERRGGRAVVVPDPIPDWTTDARVDPRRVTVVSGWGRDEPIEEVVAAAAELGDLEVVMTGRPDDRLHDLSVPKNLILSGHLDEPDYIDLLASSAVIVDLTTRPDCLVCGASEAVALGRPMVLSDTEVLRSRFGPVAVFTTNDAAAIARAVRIALETGPEMDVAAHHSALTDSWGDFKDDLLHDLARARRRRVRTWNLRREKD